VLGCCGPIFKSNSSRRFPDAASDSERNSLFFFSRKLDLLGRRFVKPRDEVELAAPAAAFRREIFPQGMSFGVVVGQEDASQVRMADKPDAHHVVDFPLQEPRAAPDPGDGIDGRVVVVNACLEPNAFAARQRQQLVDHFEPLRGVGIIGGTDVGEVVEACHRIVVQETRDFHDARRGDIDGQFGSSRVDVDGQHGLRKFLQQGFSQRIHRNSCHGHWSIATVH
jgi:hypothetical protein